METGEGRPSPDEARARLADAQQAESETRNPPLSWAFFIAQSVLIAIICSAQLLPLDVITLLGLLAMVSLGLRHVFARPGYGVVWPDGLAAFAYIVAMLVVVGVPAVLAIGLGAPWVWLAAGALGAGVTLEMGRRYRKAVGSA